MPNQVVERVFNAIAEWVKGYRRAIGLDGPFAHCDAHEVANIAKDLGITAGELQEIVRKGPDAAQLLNKMLVALKIDPKRLEELDPEVTRDLQRLCVSCNTRTRCRHELAAGTAAENYHQFCPNAFTIDAIFSRHQRSI